MIMTAILIVCFLPTVIYLVARSIGLTKKVKLFLQKLDETAEAAKKITFNNR